MAPKQRLGTLVLTISVAVAVAVGVTGWWLGLGLAGNAPASDRNDRGAQISSDYPFVTGESSTYSLSLPELIGESDIVVVAKVERRGEQWRRDGGGTGLTFLGFDYSLNVERYLKGIGEPTVTLQAPIAVEIADRNATVVFDSANPIAIGEVYYFFLRGPEKNVMLGTADPFRFRIQDGVVRAEVTTASSDGEPKLADLPWFPPMTEAEFLAEVSALVGTAATELR